jgi:hypothetical protein
LLVPGFNALSLTSNCFSLTGFKGGFVVSWFLFSWCLFVFHLTGIPLFLQTGVVGFLAASHTRPVYLGSWNMVWSDDLRLWQLESPNLWCSISWFRSILRGMPRRTQNKTSRNDMWQKNVHHIDLECHFNSIQRG